MQNEIIIFIISIFSGMINAVAGGGTFLTFPALIFSGMPAITANATSTLGLWTGSLASVFGFRNQLNFKNNSFRKIAITVLTGSVIGSSILLVIPEQNFKSFVPWLLLFATLIFSFGKRLTTLLSVKNVTISNDLNEIKAKHFISLFVLSIYGGFFGAGLGILVLALFTFMGLSDINKMNAYKKVIGATVNSIAVVIFVVAGIIDYKFAFVICAGAVIGGYIGAKYSQKLDQKLVRKAVMVIAWIVTIYSFYRY